MYLSPLFVIMTDEKMDVTVLLMCLNEEQALPKVVADIRAAFASQQYSYEILVVDDGSTDRTVAIAQELSCRVIRHASQRGAGAAYKTGVSSAQGSTIVILDADGTYTAADIPKMLAFMPEYDQVNGARTSEKGELPFLRAPAKWLVRMVVSLLAGKEIPDLQTGLKAFKKDILLPYLWVIPDKFSYATLTTLIFLCHGYKVKYIPTEYHHRIGRSKYQPFRDTVYVLMQVVRFFLYFFPGRIFIPMACLLGGIIYANSLHGQFHFDDRVYIVDNYAIKSTGHLLHNWIVYPCRFITFLSLAFNYQINGLHVLGFHLFNLGTHLLCAYFVWWLVLLTFLTPAMKDKEISKNAGLIALLSGLVFVSHPIQTESVSYIWQRASSMAALFYLASLCFYIKSRLDKGSVYYICSLIAAILAMFTKENTVTLPLMVLLYEISFFEERKPNWRYLFPFLLTILIIPLTIFLTRAPQFATIQKFMHEPGGTTPWEYLLTQFRVMVTYVRLLFVPINQNIDYDYHIAKSLFEPPILMSFIFLVSIFYTAIRLFSQYRLISFSIFWFFLTLVPESSVFPLKNIIFEHRLYLPMAGYSLLLVSGMYYLMGKKAIKAVVLVLAVIIGANAVLTYQRNKVWKDDLDLWSDAVQKSPLKARAVNNRGFAYYLHGKLPQAIADYNKAIALDPQLADAYAGRGLCYADNGNFSQSIADYNKAVAIKPDFSEAYYNRGISYLHHGDLAFALRDFTKVIAFKSNYTARAYYARGADFAQGGDAPQAIADYSKAIALDPSYVDAYYNRGLIFAQQKNFAEAILDFDKAIEINPHDADAFNNRGILYGMQGDLDHAIEDFSRAIDINPHGAQSYSNRSNAYYQKGDLNQARLDYNNALQASKVASGN